ncbi:Anaphase-promoting complex subunit 7 [Entomortierella beljakovae]|nr:Anaphase-promoting complex subunit 7 [Entomortierella beljakovae]
MDTRNARQHSSQERLTQLKLTESLYDAGLFASALLITGIHLSTTKKDEEWFQSRALTRYARCLSRLQEHKRSTEYYKKAVSLMDSPLPNDIAGVDAQLDTSGSKDSQISAPQQPVSVPQGLNAEEELEKKQRQERELIKENIIKTTSKLAAKTKRATMESSVKSANIAAALSAAGLTNTGPTTIPAVMPRSVAMKKRLTSRMDEGLDSNGSAKITRLNSLGIDPASKARILRNGAIAGPAESTTKLYDTEIDYAMSSYKSGDYVTAGNIISDIPEESRTPSVYMLIAKICRKKPSFTSLCGNKSRMIFHLDLAKKNAGNEISVSNRGIYQAAPVKCTARHTVKHDTIRATRKAMDETVSSGYREYGSDEIPGYCHKSKGNISYILYNSKTYICHDITLAALSEFSTLNERFPDNVDIKLKMALCLKRMGKTVRSCFIYSQVRKLDNYILDDMYHYGVCLKQLSKGLFINMLAGDLLKCNDLHPDTWCVQALNWDMKEDKTKALQMVSKALQICPEHCGALQIKGQLYMELAPLKALQAFREAHKIERDITTYEGLVSTYIAMERPMEAVEMAKEARKLMPDIAQAHAIFGLAIYHAGEHSYEVPQEALLKALHMDPGCAQAANCLVMIYETNSQYDNAIQILDQQIDYQPPDIIHIRKAEIYSTMEQWELALSSYQSALSSNPNNIRAREGLAEVEKILSGGDEEDEDEADELESNGLQEGDTMDADLDQEHTQDNIEEEDVITGEDERDFNEGFIRRRTTYLEMARLDQRIAQTLSRPVQVPAEQPRRHSRQLQHIPQQHRMATQNSLPGFGMDYPTTPRANNTNITNQQGFSFTNTPQREREYDEQEDDDMEE